MSKVGDAGLVLLPGEAQSVEVGAFRVLFHARREDTGGAFALLETVEPVAGSGPPLHLHRDAAESFYVLEGAYDMHVDGRDFRCEAGSFIYIPRGMRHTFRVASAGSRKLGLFTPAAMEGYFLELGKAIEAGVDDSGLAEIADRHSMEILGPAPEGYL